jgi:uncharacterized surface protein with fasciclin (FAS1) repeats
MTPFTKSTRWAAILTCAAGLAAGVAGCKSDGGMTPDKAAAMKAAPGDIIDTATGPNMEQVTTLVSLVQAAGLVDTLKGEGPFTVFAPTNEAFAQLSPATIDDLKKPENKAKLKDILLYHVHSGDGILVSEMKTMSLSTAEGKPLSVLVVDGVPTINGAKIVKPDIVCKNGVIHWVDKVIIPQPN